MAERLPNARNAARRLREARGNISYFRVGQFNLCELRVLMSDELYQDAVEVIREEHPGQEVGCDAPT
ncbi:MAG: hypothetical protein ACT4OF_05635 [Caulobacteraceae bacterium]